MQKYRDLRHLQKCECLFDWHGANASGKSNLVAVFSFIKAVLMEGLPVGSVNDFCRSKENNRARESVFELQFTVGDTFYAYGFSALLSQRRITAEWLYELMQDGGAHQLFIRKGREIPALGETVRLSATERNRFAVYAEDFAENETHLFLAEPEITTLILKHGKSAFDFSFVEESDGTKRLFDLIDMLLTDRPDTVFVVDELERSLHPKLTSSFS